MSIVSRSWSMICCTRDWKSTSCNSIDSYTSRCLSAASSRLMADPISSSVACFFFFFQAEDGIRDLIVTGVQTCALPIYFAETCSLWNFSCEHFIEDEAQCVDIRRLVYGLASDALLRCRVREIGQPFIRSGFYDCQKLIFGESSYSKVCQHHAVRGGVVKQVLRLYVPMTNTEQMCGFNAVENLHKQR